jgi:hypothetical protein
MNGNRTRFFPQNYIADVTNAICLKNVSNQLISTLKEMGAYHEEFAGEEYWIIKYADDNELFSKLLELNRMGFLFVDEPAGWPPAAVFEHLQEKYHINEKFKKVTWRGPGDWIIIE